MRGGACGRVSTAERAASVEIFVAIVVIAGVVGWVLVKNDELSGLGRNVRPGSFRSPHGRLVHVKPLGELPKAERWSARLRKSFPWVSMAALYALAALGALLGRIPAAQGAGAVVLDFLRTPVPALVVAGEALFRGGEGTRHLATYIVAVVGALIGQLLLFLPAFLAIWAASAAGVIGDAIVPVDLPSWAFFVLSFAGFALGAALVLARTGRLVRFRRRFADGSESEIEVSTNSVAYGAYRELADERRGAGRTGA